MGERESVSKNHEIPFGKTEANKSPNASKIVVPYVSKINEQIKIASKTIEVRKTTK